jgi:glycopeptide antibiotics resistance protein
MSGASDAARVAAGRYLALSVGVIVAAVVPWATFRAHSHWAKVIWVPFSTPPELRAADVVGNVLLYVPFGYFFCKRAARLAGVHLRGVFWAFLLSMLTELTQVYSHSRFPSTTDLVLNVAGAIAGVHLAWRGRSRF